MQPILFSITPLLFIKHYLFLTNMFPHKPNSHLRNYDFHKFKKLLSFVKIRNTYIDEHKKFTYCNRGHNFCI